jgi:hypothetical protein
MFLPNGAPAPFGTTAGTAHRQFISPERRRDQSDRVGVMARYDARMVETVEIAPGGGTSDGLFQLGLMHCVGRDVPLDLVAAHKWFNLAALRGNADARRYRTEIAGEMTRQEIAEAQRQAREWLSCH